MSHASARGVSRGARLAAAGLALFACSFASSCGGGEGAVNSTSGSAANAPGDAPGDGPKDWAKDDRILGLMENCATLGTFSGDTSDLMAVLVSKLERGSMDVLHNVREELAREGQAAIPELERLVRRLYTEPHGSHAVVNALGVLRMSEAGGSPRALALLEDCLGHPRETVQTAAIKALAEHADPEAYDDLQSLLPITNDQARAALFSALQRADPRRFEADLAGWIIEGRYQGQWPHAARLVAQSADEHTGERFADFAAGLGDPATRAFLLATLVDHAGSGARELLEDLLEDPDPQLRGVGLAALEYTDLVRPAARVLRGDQVASLRSMAVSLLAENTDEDFVREALHDGLNDSDETVRLASLSALLAAGDAAAADFTVACFGGSQRDLQLSVRAVAGNWDANPELAGRVLAVLEERLEQDRVRPLRERAVLYQALGQVPGPSSTALLLDDARTERGMHGNMSAFRWLMIQASNTGVTGRELLAQAWRDEPDLERRMDLLWAATTGHDKSTASFLREVLLAERSAPHERLYVAERLAREGPASMVAPLIKRATLREGDAVFRPALNCLLWRWYGRS